LKVGFYVKTHRRKKLSSRYRSQKRANLFVYSVEEKDASERIEEIIRMKMHYEVFIQTGLLRMS